MGSDRIKNKGSIINALDGTSETSPLLGDGKNSSPAPTPPIVTVSSVQALAAQGLPSNVVTREPRKAVTISAKHEVASLEKGATASAITEQPHGVVNQELVNFLHSLGYPNMTENVLNSSLDISLPDNAKHGFSKDEQETLCKHLNSLKKTLVHARHSASWRPTTASLKAVTHPVVMECIPAFATQGFGSKAGESVAELLNTNGNLVYDPATSISQLAGSALLWGAMSACGTGVASTVSTFYLEPILNGMRSQLLGGDYRLVSASIDELLPTPCNIDPITGRKLSNDELKARHLQYKTMKSQIADLQEEVKPHLGAQAIALNALLYGVLSGATNISIGKILPGLLVSLGAIPAAAAAVLLQTAASSTSGVITSIIQHEILSNRTTDVPTISADGNYDLDNKKSMCLVKAKNVLPPENPENKSIFTRTREKTLSDALANRPFTTKSEVLALLSDEAKNRIALALVVTAVPVIIRPFGISAENAIAMSGYSKEEKDGINTVLQIGKEVLTELPGMYIWPKGLLELERLTAERADNATIKDAIAKVDEIRVSAERYLSMIAKGQTAAEEWLLGFYIGGLDEYEKVLVCTQDNERRSDVQILKKRLGEELELLKNKG